MYKVRVGFDKRLVEFDSFQSIFDWIWETQAETVKETQLNCVFSVLTYERGELEAMDRWWFDGHRFTQENILS